MHFVERIGNLILSGFYQGLYFIFREEKSLLLFKFYFLSFQTFFLVSKVWPWKLDDICYHFLVTSSFSQSLVFFLRKLSRLSIRGVVHIVSSLARRFSIDSAKKIFFYRKKKSALLFFSHRRVSLSPRSCL